MSGTRGADSQNYPGLRVAILEDHRLLAAVLGAALAAEGHEVSVPELSDLASVVAGVATNRPEIALLDLDLGDFGSGETLLPSLVSSGARVIVVTASTDGAVIGGYLHAGADGWVPKSAPFETLIGAIRRAAAGQPLLDAPERDRLLGLWRQRRLADAAARAPFQRLSRRESVVLAALLDGRSVERIARESFVSEATVRTQVRAILTKLGVNSQLEAVAMAVRAGWTCPE